MIYSLKEPLAGRRDKCGCDFMKKLDIAFPILTWRAERYRLNNRAYEQAKAATVAAAVVIRRRRQRLR